MTNLLNTFLFVLFVTYSFQPAKSQNCMKFSASTCEDGTDPLQHPPSVPVTQGLPGKRGPAGSPGEKGEPGIPGRSQRVAVSQLENEVATLKRDLNAAQTKIERRYTLKLTPKPGNFDETRQMCVDMGGDLIQKCISRRVHGVTYERQITEFTSMNINPGALWIGITVRDGTWVYLNGQDFYGHNEDGEDLMYFWGNGQPQPGEDCGGIQLSSLSIHDYHCTTKFFGLCEVPV